MKVQAQAQSGHFSAELNHARIDWELDQGRLSFFGIRSALFWTDPSLLKLLEPLAAEVGYDLFRMMVAHSSSQGTSEDYHAMVTVLAGNFTEGFLAWGNCVSAAGWGRFELPVFDTDQNIARVVVRNPWELSMQSQLRPEKTWGCPFLMGKVIGIFSHALEVNCWADEHLDPTAEHPSVTFEIYPSDKTITNEITQLQKKRMHERERLLAEEVEAQTLQLSMAQQRLEDYSRNLEKRVDERTQSLQNALDELRRAQAKLVQAEKMAGLGQLVAGVAHEINNPLGAIQASAEEIQSHFQGLEEDWKRSNRWFQGENAELVQAFLSAAREPRDLLSFRERRALKKMHARPLDEAEIEHADDIANVLVELGFSTPIDRFLPIFKNPQCEEILDCAVRLSAASTGIADILQSVGRAAKTVFALKVYAHHEPDGRPHLATLQNGLENVLTIYQHRLRYDVELIREYQDLPPISGFHDELNQVWTNLIHNALHAMDGSGTLTLKLEAKVREHLKGQSVSIGDDGCGMSEETLQRMFEPFYTTKPAGEGSGLGLDIVRQIVEKHGGRIGVESRIGEGSLFEVWLPQEQEGIEFSS